MNRNASEISSNDPKIGLQRRENLDNKSTDSDILQKIIEQRQFESSSDSEESEEDLSSDYDIGIDDLSLETGGDEDIHTATEEEESNILNESLDSRADNPDDFHLNQLKKVLPGGRDTSPFTDVMEKGLQNYMN
mmetsp:Transcript_18476/g.16350  ORF Transcript_18476/g.16350 Transcript_18476/m.16350 type:complete len:134 (+) Transcript_18476:244-645(+)|eukprot:CAMPEP_0205807048 /NCGR_PEP_ID=MMETSP0205-20121125/10716_1 /ASSEMBLY_ACC=CAM_ASM_000278 /TAXON_ID=36767 /ORGANISM="Euplotes focardii, Strain TN1" /LENGTH=133 /DNA_ID=CAMNT_0053080765 /DNA_START=232 /DNA_END=633 /DNA_ORIENTATION=+